MRTYVDRQEKGWLGLLQNNSDALSGAEGVMIASHQPLEVQRRMTLVRFKSRNRDDDRLASRFVQTPQPLNEALAQLESDRH